MNNMPTIGKAGRKSLPIDVNTLIESRLLAVANSGAGKSWCIRRLLEQTHGHVQQLVIDPDGEYTTLREKYDYLLVGGEGADIQADPRSAALLACRLLELRVSAILDIYELKKPLRRLFVKNFIGALVDAPKELWHPVMVVIDEAHDYAPEKGSAVSSEAVIDLMARGRKRGQCGILGTQRVSKLDKDAAAEANNLLIGRCALDIDQKRAADMLGFSGKAKRNGLRDLKPGEFYAYGPALSDQVTAVKVGPVVTTHPKAGQRAKLPPPPRGAIKKLVAELSDLPAKAEEEVRDLNQAMAQINKLSRENRQLRNSRLRDQLARIPAPEIDAKKISEAVTKAIAKVTTQHQREFKAAQSSVVRVAAGMEKAIDTLRKEIIRCGDLAAVEVTIPNVKAEPVFTGAGSANNATPRKVSGTAAEKILGSLSWWRAAGVDAPTRMQVAFMARYSPRSSGFKKLISTLSSSGLVDYPDAGCVSLTEEGISQAPFANQPSTEEFQRLVFDQVGPAHQSVLEPLVEHYPESLSREALGEASGRSASSSGYKKIVSTLSSLGLVNYPSTGYVCASSQMFLQ